MGRVDADLEALFSPWGATGVEELEVREVGKATRAPATSMEGEEHGGV